MLRVVTLLLLAGQARPLPADLASAPMPQPAPVVQTFRPAEVKLAWIDRRWMLTHDGQVLKDFGPREQDARHALRLIQELRLNQRGTVGAPAVMEYWLCDGVAPHAGVRPEFRPVTFEPAGLRVEQMQGRWCVRDRTRVLFDFPQKAEAAQALEVIRQHHFDRVGVVGQASPMHVFLGKPAGSMPAVPDSRIEPTRFSRLAKAGDGKPKVEAPKTEPAFAGLSLGSLPPVTRPAAASAGPTQTTLTGRQVPLWRDKPQIGTVTQPPAAADRVPFDWRRVEIRQDGADWKLFAGTQVLADFGPNAAEARLALSAVRHYRFTEERRLAGERPVNYCAASAMAPRGVMLGLHARVLAPEQVQVQQMGGGFALYEGQQVVMRLGDRREDADRMVEAIKANKYDRLCQFGEPGKPGLAVFVRSR